MANVDQLIARLDGVKQTRPNQWLARCPAHEDHSPSLSIKETAEGLLLLKCWAGCETESILTALNLSFSDLFPERLPDSYQRAQSRSSLSLSSAEQLDVLHHEITVASLVLHDVVESKTISEEDWSRFITAANRIHVVRNHGR